MKLINSAYELAMALGLILRNEKGLINRIKLFLIYLKLAGKYHFIVKLLHINLKKEKVFGYKIHFPYYKLFRNLVTEIFIMKEYEFRAKRINPFILDCGSNIGMATLFFKKRYPNAKIICFEPDRDVFSYLKQNVQKNKLTKVSLNNAAVTGKGEKIRFYSNGESCGGGITKSWVKDYANKAVEEYEVESAVLSKFVDEPVDLLKLDVESAEYSVLEELSKSQKLKMIKEIIMEYHYNPSRDIDNTGNDNSLAGILKLFEENGFRYVISSFMRSPFAEHRGNPYLMMIYAYKEVR